MEITINTKNKRTQQNIKESLERATLATIRQKFDLATSTGQSIYLLLKDIDEEGVRLMMERYRDKVKQELNLLDSPYEVRKEQVSFNRRSPTTRGEVDCGGCTRASGADRASRCHLATVGDTDLVSVPAVAH